MGSARDNWTASMNWQIDFYARGNSRPRTDPEFPWDRGGGPARALRRMGKRALQALGVDHLRARSDFEWWGRNAESLWRARAILSDDMSRLLFDEAIVLRLTGYEQFYFPRIDFDDYLEIGAERPFISDRLPSNYEGSPLRLFEVNLPERPEAGTLQLVTRRENISLINSYRQYTVRRNSVDISPSTGDTVIDCGACIGDNSVIFAGLAGSEGQVHLFDPVPLHARFCRHQAALNPALAGVFTVNELAVGGRSVKAVPGKSGPDSIDTGYRDLAACGVTTLDDYSHALKRVDFIKMDVEGAEVEALDGAAGLIAEFKPRLAICAYHKPDDLWVIPEKIKALFPGYELYFGHHSPTGFESVFYAVLRR